MAGTGNPIAKEKPPQLQRLQLGDTPPDKKFKLEESYLCDPASDQLLTGHRIVTERNAGSTQASFLNDLKLNPTGVEENPDENELAQIQAYYEKDGYQVCLGRPEVGKLPAAPRSRPAFLITRNRKLENYCSGNENAFVVSLGQSILKSYAMTLLEMGQLSLGDYCVDPAKSDAHKVALKLNTSVWDRELGIVAEMTGIPRDKITKDMDFANTDLSSHSPFFNPADVPMIAGSITLLIKDHLRQESQVQWSKDADERNRKMQKEMFWWGTVSGAGPSLILGIIGTFIQKRSLAMMREQMDMMKEQLVLFKKMHGDDKKHDLKSLGLNLTEEARAGKYRDVEGMGWAMDLMDDNLSKSFNANFLLLGPPGTGKTATVKAWINKLLMDARYANTDFIILKGGDIRAGMKYYGEVEERVKKIFGEVRTARAEGRRIVLIIDEFHALFLDHKGEYIRVNWIEENKDLLEDGTVSIGGMTTGEEYAGIKRMNPALARRFGEIDIPEKSWQETLAILKQQIAPAVLKDNNIRIEEDAIKLLAYLKQHEEGYFPAKAIDPLTAMVESAARNGKAVIDEDFIIQYLAKSKNLSVEEYRAYLDSQRRLRGRIEAAQVLREEASVELLVRSLDSAADPKIENILKEGDLKAELLDQWRKLPRPTREVFIQREEMGGGHYGEYQEGMVPRTFLEDLLERKGADVGAIISSRRNPSSLAGLLGTPKSGGNGSAKTGIDTMAGERGDAGFAEVPPSLLRLVDEAKERFRTRQAVHGITSAAGTWGMLAGLHVAEHEGWITPKQKDRLDWVMLGAFQAANPMALPHMGLTLPGFVGGQVVTESLLDLVGLPRGGLPNTLGGIAGGVGGGALTGHVAGTWAKRFGLDVAARGVLSRAPVLARGGALLGAAGQVAGAFVAGYQVGSLIAETGVLDNAIDWLAGYERPTSRRILGPST